MPMVGAKFHLFQIQEKMVAPDSIIAPQLCLGERPKALNGVSVVPFSGELSFAVVDPVVPVAVREESVVGTERIGVDRAWGLSV